jgi:hypothetical protein
MLPTGLLLVSSAPWPCALGVGEREGCRMGWDPFGDDAPTTLAVISAMGIPLPCSLGVGERGDCRIMGWGPFGNGTPPLVAISAMGISVKPKKQLNKATWLIVTRAAS